jgi:hypothetical protein
MGNLGMVPGGGNPTWRGFQARDAATVGGHADGPAAIAANSARGAAGCNRRGFPAAGTAGGAFEIPWIGGPARDVVVGLVVGKEFGAVGLAEDHGAGGFEASYRGGVSGGFVA